MSIMEKETKKKGRHKIRTCVCVVVVGDIIETVEIVWEKDKEKDKWCI